MKGLVLPFPLNSASLEHSNGGTIEVVGGGGRVSLGLRRIGGEDCNGGTIEIVGGGGLIVGLYFVAVVGEDSGSSEDRGWVR